MNKQEAINILKDAMHDCTSGEDEPFKEALGMGILSLESDLPKKVYHFQDDDTFETTCCGVDITGEDYKFCPECGCELGEIEEVEGEDE